MKFNLLSLTIIASLFFSLSISSCKKDTGKTTVTLELEHKWANAAFSLNNDFTTESNQTVNLSKLKYLLSNFVFKKSDGTEYKVPESYYLVNALTPSTFMLDFQDIPEGDYTSVKFIVGVDSARNTAGAQKGALATTNDLYWDWNMGYVFFKAEGTSPQNAMGLTYHIGGYGGAEAAQRTITLDFAGNKLLVRNSKEVEVHASVDIKKVFKNVDVASLGMVHMPGANALKIADNYATLFEFEHVHN
jgi:hypothetical protein